jgi:hypothetical protein
MHIAAILDHPCFGIALFPKEEEARDLDLV